MRRLAIIAVSLVAFLTFGYALWRLFDLRFANGDVYPPGSSFRADPLGARALYESYDLVPGVRTERLLEPVRWLGSGRDTTLFIFACPPSEERILSATDAAELNDFLLQGGRVVVTFSPTSGRPFWNPLKARGTPTPTTNAPARRPVTRRQSSAANGEPEDVAFTTFWNFQFEYPALPPATNGTPAVEYVSRTEAAPAVLPATLAWNSAAVFTGLDTNWTVLYARSNQPVLVERTFGRGSVVLASDTAFHRNETLRRGRSTALLAWLAGDNHRLVFEETHLGSQLNPGIMTLARRYRLHGLGAGLLLLAGLYVWRTMTNLVPRLPDPGGKPDEVVTGKDSATGFVNLLRRAVSPAELLLLCFAEWKKTGARNHPGFARKTAAMQDVVNLEAAKPVKEQNPVDAYRKLSQILTER